MFCTTCGSQNPEVGAFCFNCGKPLVTHGSAVGTSAAAVSPAPEVMTAPSHSPDAAAPEPAESLVDPEIQRLRSEHPEWVGVGGWLGWFCIIATVISPLVILAGIASQPSVYSVFDVALGAFSVYTGVCLWKVLPRALRMTKILLIVQFCIGALLLLGQIVDSSAKSDPAVMRMLVGAIVWFSYFKKSKRVKATFGRTI